jgi:hypothetical protein
MAGLTATGGDQTRLTQTAGACPDAVDTRNLHMSLAAVAVLVFGHAVSLDPAVTCPMMTLGSVSPTWHSTRAMSSPTIS